MYHILVHALSINRPPPFWGLQPLGYFCLGPGFRKRNRFELSKRTNLFGIVSFLKCCLRLVRFIIFYKHDFETLIEKFFIAFSLYKQSNFIDIFHVMPLPFNLIILKINLWKPTKKNIINVYLYIIQINSKKSHKRKRQYVKIKSLEPPSEAIKVPGILWNWKGHAFRTYEKKPPHQHMRESPMGTKPICLNRFPIFRRVAFSANKRHFIAVSFFTRTHCIQILRGRKCARKVHRVC